MRLVYLLIGYGSAFGLLNSAYAYNAGYPALLGNGYDSLKLEHKMTQCVDGLTFDQPHIEASQKITKVENWSQLQAQMNFQVPGSIILQSGSELAKFTLRARDTQFTSSYIFENHVSMSQKIIKNPKLNVSINDPAHFREECGTQYISSVTTGGILYVTFQFSFSDSEFKQEFDAGGSIQTLMGLGAHVSALSNVAKKHSSVTIFVYQVGGDPAELNNLFETGDIISCSLANFDKCESLLKTVWNYSNRFTRTVLEGKNRIIEFQADDYPNVPHVYENLKVKREREKLLLAVDRQEYERDFLTSLKGERLKNYVNCNDRCLSRLLFDVMSNMRTLHDAIRLSFDDPNMFLNNATYDQLELNPIELPVEKSYVYEFFIQQLAYYGPPAIAITVVGVLVKFVLLSQGVVH